MDDYFLIGLSYYDSMFSFFIALTVDELISDMKVLGFSGGSTV